MNVRGRQHPFANYILQIAHTAYAPSIMRKVPRVILLLESSRASGRSLLRGIADYARHHGPWEFYWEPHGLREVWPQLRTLDAQGIILRDVDRVKDVSALGIPAIVVGHSRKEIPGLVNVVTESKRVGHLAAEHLTGCGLQHFAYCGDCNNPWSRERSASFRQQLATRGHDVEFFRPPTTNAQQVRPALKRWLLSLPRPVGLLAENDDYGEQIIETCKIAGIRIPDEVAVLGVDNDELVCELSAPPMSSVALNFERAGYESARALERLMQRQPVHARTILVQATHVVARQSTDILATDDPAVVKALHFIREHAQKTMSVTDVARAAGVSRRTLEKRFRAVVDRSVLKEIRCVRCDRIARLLTETNLSVARIAESLDFENQQHLARYFRAEKDTTPLAYRKQHGRS